MRKQFIQFFVLILFAVGATAQLQSPEQFLGYKIGTRYTPHYKIVNYVKAVAQSKPDMVKLQPYGETNEGRELLVAFIALPENLQRLEAIRTNNLALAGMGAGQPTTQNMPAVVWLSYNVHGNETSSSEAAMLTLYSLVDPANAQTKEWLKNTVVVIDPCINPDGRDRYVNWFNAVAGTGANADPNAREHSEPWPGGRTNHYNFDLNRDWAWQTQVETRQRLKLYNSWLPQIHVDYHEQSPNNPYYFAPAAQPYHEVITPWQREFQNIIGRNNAKYFDQNGWTFFTRESFDLFYPSYGDTYPLYNGAIGMTFEQGGGPRGGLAIKTNSGDTLTLLDRVTHHYTTGLSTIEAAAGNSQRLLTEFKKFYEDSKAGRGTDVKTYVLTSDNVDKIKGVASLLKSNGIAYGSVANTAFKGYNYISNKEETGKPEKYNIAVSMMQPKSVLARVLLEPKSTLVDSNTYDITAWSLPFVYGVDAYSTREALPIKAFDTTELPRSVPASSYGYLVRYTSVEGAKALAYLLHNGAKVKVAEKRFTYHKQQYEAGTLIILQKNNVDNLSALLNETIGVAKVNIEPVATGFMDEGPDFGSPDIKSLRVPKVALITGEQTSSLGAGEVWNFFEQQLKYPLTLINANDLGRATLSDYNVLIMPDGYYRNINDKNIADKLKDFVNAGGNLIAMESAVQKLAAGDWGIKLKESKDDDKDKDKDKTDYAMLKKYENRERDEIRNLIPGAIYKVDLDNSHPLAFGYPGSYYTLKQDPGVYEFLKDGWNVGYIKKDNYVAGFAGTKVKAELRDGTIFGVVEQGSGTVTFMADDPLFRMFWENGKLLFSNAVFFVGQ